MSAPGWIFLLLSVFGVVLICGLVARAIIQARQRCQLTDLQRKRDAYIESTGQEGVSA